MSRTSIPIFYIAPQATIRGSQTQLVPKYVRQVLNNKPPTGKNMISSSRGQGRQQGALATRKQTKGWRKFFLHRSSELLPGLLLCVYKPSSPGMLPSAERGSITICVMKEARYLCKLKFKILSHVNYQ